MAVPTRTLPDNLTTEQVTDMIFKDPIIKHGLTELKDFGENLDEVLSRCPFVVACRR